MYQSTLVYGLWSQRAGLFVLFDTVQIQFYRNRTDVLFTPFVSVHLVFTFYVWYQISTLY